MFTTIISIMIRKTSESGMNNMIDQETQNHNIIRFCGEFNCAWHVSAVQKVWLIVLEFWIRLKVKNKKRELGSGTEPEKRNYYIFLLFKAVSIS